MSVILASGFFESSESTESVFPSDNGTIVSKGISTRLFPEYVVPDYEFVHCVKREKLQSSRVCPGSPDYGLLLALALCWSLSWCRLSLL
jgi:hypothetical protein